MLLFFIEKYINFVYSADLNFSGIQKNEFNRIDPTCYLTNFPYTSSGLRNGALSFIVQLVMRLTYNVHPRLDSDLELCWTSRLVKREYDQEILHS